MGYYAKPEKQAQRVIRWGLALGSGRRDNKTPGQIHSLSTASAYRSALTTFCRWIQENQLGNLVQANVKTCSRFLEERAVRVGQKTLDRDRQAIQYLLTRTTSTNVRLPRIFLTDNSIHQCIPACLRKLFGRTRFGFLMMKCAGSKPCSLPLLLSHSSLRP